MDEDAHDPRQDELDGLRIRQLAALRRASYRACSYAIIAAAACVVVTAQLGWMTIRYVRSIGFGWRSILCIVLSIASIWGAIYFARWAGLLHQEAKRSMLEKPATPPDFSTLSDGSQMAKNLEDVR